MGEEAKWRDLTADLPPPDLHLIADQIRDTKVLEQPRENIPIGLGQAYYWLAKAGQILQLLTCLAEIKLWLTN